MARFWRNEKLNYSLATYCFTYKEKVMNKVSIIINGIRYDAKEGIGCTECAFFENCKDQCVFFELPLDKVFKKSDKKFEV